ncbi:MAG: hypothetical protein DRH90_03265 [Deltaproteobacteria bacterium]|nr:MAG: hypothetical protein DRH90_03265 [Deltaproteobacteria bacterium]RLC16938.1 MAG: hypothetical protein DRI24_07105 [Deltaproteobacteria bacterium]
MPTPASQQALVGLRDLWWDRSFKGVWLIFLFGYFHFYVAALLVVGMKTNKSKMITIGSLYGIAIVANGVAMGLLGWRY